MFLNIIIIKVFHKPFTQFWTKWKLCRILFLPSANEVCEGYVFTDACLSMGVWVCVWHACPKACTPPGTHAHPPCTHVPGHAHPPGHVPPQECLHAPSHAGPPGIHICPPRHARMPPSMHTYPPGMQPTRHVRIPPPHKARTHVSYWNTFLLQIIAVHPRESNWILNTFMQ